MHDQGRFITTNSTVASTECTTGRRTLQNKPASSNQSDKVNRKMTLPRRSLSSWWAADFGIFLAFIIAISIPQQASAQPLFYSPIEFAVKETFQITNEVNIVHEQGAYWAWYPKQPWNEKIVGYIFHPNIWYDERAYAPVARALAFSGIPTFILDVPVSFSFLTPYRADTVLRDFPNITSWIVGGHGIGGQVAAHYAQARRHIGPVDGLALFASAPAPLFTDLSLSGIKAISAWGSLDGIFSRIEWEDGKKMLPPDADFRELQGGNHANWAYLINPQAGDGAATVTRDAQIAFSITAVKILVARVEAQIFKRKKLKEKESDSGDSSDDRRRLRRSHIYEDSEEEDSVEEDYSLSLSSSSDEWPSPKTIQN